MFRVFSRVFGRPGVSSLSSLLFSLCLPPAGDLCVRLGSCLLFPLSAAKHFARPRVYVFLSLSLCFFFVFVIVAQCKSPSIDSDLF